jgi:hypothetical protein
MLQLSQRDPKRSPPLGAESLWSSLDTSGSPVRYALIAWPVATVPALALGAIIDLVAPEFGTHPPHEALSVALTAWVIGIAPVLETGIMVIVSYLLRLVLPRYEKLQILFLALAAALAHAVNDTWLRAILVIWPLLIYSAALISWRKRSTSTAFFVAASIHSLHNATVVAVGALLLVRPHAL